jgi:hypothetical protein
MRSHLCSSPTSGWGWGITWWITLLTWQTILLTWWTMLLSSWYWEGEPQAGRRSDQSWVLQMIYCLEEWEFCCSTKPILITKDPSHFFSSLYGHSGTLRGQSSELNPGWNETLSSGFLHQEAIWAGYLSLLTWRKRLTMWFSVSLHWHLSFALLPCPCCWSLCFPSMRNYQSLWTLKIHPTGYPAWPATFDLFPVTAIIHFATLTSSYWA